jgi:hypothetical protein
MLRRVALVRTDVSEELGASIIKVTRIGEIGTTLAVTSNPTGATRRNISEDAILHSHCRENLNLTSAAHLDTTQIPGVTAR